MIVRPCEEADLAAAHLLINEAAQSYKGVIPKDCWHEPYMSAEELRREVDSGVVFWGYEQCGVLLGVMGIQHVGDVTLIRHAYVLTTHRRQGIGSALLSVLKDQTERPLLVGTWADAVWAIRFYQKHDFMLVTPAEKDRLLKAYWSIPGRQIETSVVLAGDRWFESAAVGPA